MKAQERKFKKGQKVQVSAKLIFKGLTGIVEFCDRDEDGEIYYLLTDIVCPKTFDKEGKEYQFKSSFFYQSWLSLV